MTQNKAKIKAVFRCIVCFFCSVILFALTYLVCIKFEQRMLGAVEIADKNGVGLNFQTAQKINSTQDIMIGTAMSYECGVNYNNSLHNALLIATNPQYGYILNLNYISGSYFPSNANKYVVISDVLSQKIFNTTQTVGNELVLNKEFYKICGVYKESSNLLDEISVDNTEKIFVSSVNEYEPITQLLIKSEISNAQFCKAQAESLLQMTITGNVHDLRKPVELAWFFLYAAFLFVLFLPMFWIIKYAAKNICNLYYGNFSVKTSIVRLFINILLIAAICVSLFALLSYINIPQQYLPFDNLFDFSFYKESLVNYFVLSNSENSPINFYPKITVYLTSVLTFSFVAAFCMRNSIRYATEFLIKKERYT